MPQFLVSAASPSISIIVLGASTFSGDLFANADVVRGRTAAKDVSNRKSSRSSTKRTYARTIIPNSSDVDEDDITMEDKKSAQPSAPARRVLKEVAIPAANSKKAAPGRERLSIKALRKGEQDSSTGSPSLDNSDYETPGTSISTTPAASIRRSAKTTRRSGLSEALSASIGASSSRKRGHAVILDSEDEGDHLDIDAELALQMQMEQDEQDRKRRRTGDGDITSLDSEDEEIVPPKRKAPAYTGKGKGKAIVYDSMDLASDEGSLLHTPAFKGKGKGKAKAEDLPSSRGGRSVRSSAKRKTVTILDDGLSDQESDDEDEFKLEDEDIDLDDAEDDNALDLASDSDDDIPLSLLSKKVIPTPSRSKRGRVPRGKKYKAPTGKEKAARERRLEKYSHIEDKWDRKRAMNRDRLEEAHPKLITMWETLKTVPVLEVQQAEQPKSITRRLKPFQLEGLSWLTRQEKTAWKGGLLGDEMGMGKTIQAVSLIMSDFPAKDPTLVVVPPVALMQWSNEIREYTDGKLKVLVYHGTNAKCKKMTIKDLKKFDVIMVSYNSLESLHRKETKGWARGEDIIKEASPLHAIHYHRLILDEAHSIKSRTTGVAKACFALKGSYKWCLSGTPVQNRIGEFFSLLRFLEVRPFADYFCRSCDCEQLHWTVDEDHMCKACDHGASEHVSIFNQELLNPITGDDPELREDALTKLHMITARIMLRRMKRDHTNSMELPMKDIIIHNEFFSEVERDFSTSIMSNSARKFDTYVAQGVMLNNYANIFGLIMQMRQVANHPDLLLKKKSAEGGQNVYVCNICDEPAEDAVRSRCHHEFCRACIKDFMDTCEFSGTEADCPRCHIALSIDFEQPELEQDEDSVKKNSIINRIKMENWTSSTKIEMLVYDLYKLRSKKQTLKSIVFSQFTSMLQLIEWRLRRAGFNTVMLDGSMTPAMRQKSIEHFMTNPDVEVFLVSLKAGGVALNLTEASRVFIVDP
jgi:DNA repair protein RAD16